eukprot:12740013-Alexandrium_andersonii.AAC.1
MFTDSEPRTRPLGPLGWDGDLPRRALGPRVRRPCGCSDPWALVPWDGHRATPRASGKTSSNCSDWLEECGGPEAFGS